MIFRCGRPLWSGAVELRSSRGDTSGGGTSSTGVRVVAALVGLQGAALIAAAAILTVQVFTEPADNRTTAVALTLLVLVSGVAVLLIGRALAARRPLARTPALVVQIFAGLSGASFVQGSQWYVGVVLLVWAIAVTALLFTPSVSRALGE